MILIGQYDSPFVRRVAITLRLCGRQAVGGDAARSQGRAAESLCEVATA
jgi:hypothetical protein